MNPTGWVPLLGAPALPPHPSLPVSSLEVSLAQVEIAALVLLPAGLPIPRRPLGVSPSLKSGRLWLALASWLLNPLESTKG